MIDLYRILPEEFFEQIGDFDTNEEKYAPINYEEVTMSLYEPNSFFGPEFTYLYVDDEEKIWYIEICQRQPVGDYGWQTVYSWWKSIDGKFEDIKNIVNKAFKEDKISS